MPLSDQMNEGPPGGWSCFLSRDQDQILSRLLVLFDEVAEIGAHLQERSFHPHSAFMPTFPGAANREIDTGPDAALGVTRGAPGLDRPEPGPGGALPQGFFREQMQMARRLQVGTVPTIPPVRQAVDIRRCQYEPSARPQHAATLPDQGDRIVNVLDHLIHGHRVERIAREREAFQVTEMDGQTVFHARRFDRFGIDLQSLDMPTLPSHPDQEIPFSAPDVEQPTARDRLAEIEFVGLFPPFLLDSPESGRIQKQLVEGLENLDGKEVEGVDLLRLFRGKVPMREIDPVGLPDFLFQRQRVQPNEAAFRARTPSQAPRTRSAESSIGQPFIQENAIGTAQVTSRHGGRPDDVRHRGGIRQVAYSPFPNVRREAPSTGRSGFRVPWTIRCTKALSFMFVGHALYRTT